MRERAEEDARPGLRGEPRLLDAGVEVDVRADGHPLDGCARESRREQVDRVARARHERNVARPEQHPQQVHEPFFRAERERRLGLGVEPDAEALAVQIADRLPQLGQAPARGVAMIAREQSRLAQLLDGELGWWDIRVAETEVDDVVARAS